MTTLTDALALARWSCVATFNWRGTCDFETPEQPYMWTASDHHLEIRAIPAGGPVTRGGTPLVYGIRDPITKRWEMRQTYGRERFPTWELAAKVADKIAHCGLTAGREG